MSESAAPPKFDVLDLSRPIARAELLLVICVPMRVTESGDVCYDLQSRDSLQRYLKWFKSIIVATPRLPEESVTVSDNKNFVWIPSNDLCDRVQFVPLPTVRRLWHFPRDYAPTARVLSRCIDAAEHLEFALGGGNCGLEYDWGAVGAEIAIKKGRKFALLTDAVSYESHAMHARTEPRFHRRLRARLYAYLVRKRQWRLISQCDLMFCNGMDTFLAFSPLCKAPDVAVKINDFQIGPEQLLPAEKAEAKARAAADRQDLRVCYAGRVESQKAPLDWVRAIGEARRLGAEVRGIWLGKGSLLDAMRDEVHRLGLSDVIDLPGFVSDRDQVFERIRFADVMAFTHIEPESPRVLIESLMAACPIVGYDRPHPADLISVHGGGEMTPFGDWKALGASLARLTADRARLADLIRRAYRDGCRFDSEIMTRDRCALKRQRLT